ncbi:MAG: DUF1572 domain-containing protein [candidate division Zixibacteria bacterium]|nr:DUF1572 domain-containing protein [candidate division Zixibacteria bacterium]
MNLTTELARHLREAHFGGSMTGVNLKDALKDVSWQQATKQIYTFNTIASLVYHMNYYVRAVLKVLKGGPLDAHDKYSFDLSPIESEDDWEDLLENVWADAEAITKSIEQMPESKLRDTFWDEKYGNYYRNIQGVIEHFHYHLGQIVLIKKILLHSRK